MYVSKFSLGVLVCTVIEGRMSNVISFKNGSGSIPDVLLVQDTQKG